MKSFVHYNSGTTKQSCLDGYFSGSTVMLFHMFTQYLIMTIMSEIRIYHSFKTKTKIKHRSSIVQRY